jgi:hypothetical protein
VDKLNDFERLYVEPPPQAPATSPSLTLSVSNLG